MTFRPKPHGVFMALWLTPLGGAREDPVMFDFLLVALGTGGILLIAAYAMLCEHV